MQKILPGLLLIAGVAAMGAGASVEDPWATLAMRELIVLVEDPNPQVRLAAKDALSKVILTMPQLVWTLLQDPQVSSHPFLRTLARKAQYLVSAPQSVFEELVRFFLLNPEALRRHFYEEIDEVEMLLADISARLAEDVGNRELLSRLTEALQQGIRAEQVAAVHCLLELARTWDDALLALGQAITTKELDPLIQAFIFRALRGLGTRITLLVPEFLDHLVLDPEIRRLLVAQGEAVVPTLAQALNHPRRTQREAALELLVSLGEKAEGAVSAVLELLEREPLPEVRQAALAALGAIGKNEPKVVPVLMRAAKSRDPEEISAALAGMGRLGSVALEALDIVLLCVYHPMPAVRRAALQALGAIAPLEIALPHLLRALGDEHSDVRVAAMDILGSLGAAAQAAIPALLDRLKDPDPKIRAAAALSLSRIGSDSQALVPELMQLLADEAFAVRVAAVRALGNLGPLAEAAIPELLKLLEQKDTRWKWCEEEELKKAVEEALGKIGVQALSRWFDRLVSDEEAQQLLEALDELFMEALQSAFSQITYEHVHPLALGFRVFRQQFGVEVLETVGLTPDLRLEVKQWAVLRPEARALVKALGQTKKDLWLAFCSDEVGIQQLLEHRSPVPRLLGLALLLGCGKDPAELEQRLFAAAKDPESTVRMAAWAAIFPRNLRPSGELLAEGLGDRHPAVRALVLMGAVRQLVVDPQEKKVLLMQALADPAELVRWSAALGVLLELKEVPDEARPHFLQMLNEESVSLQRLACANLARARVQEAVPYILELAVQYRFDWSFAFMLAWYGDDLLPIVAEILAQSEPRYHEPALLALRLALDWDLLSAQGLRKALDVLLQAVRHESPSVREDAVHLLPSVHRRNPKLANVVLDTLMDVLESETEREVLSKALLALALVAIQQDFSDPSVAEKVTSIMAISKDLWAREPALRFYAALAWKSLGPWAAEAAPLLFAEWVTQIQEVKGLERLIPLEETLVALGEAAVPYLLEALPQPELQLRALFLFENMGPAAQQALPHILTLLKTTPDDRVRTAAIAAISSILGGKEKD